MTNQMTPDLESRLQAWLAGRAPADLPDALVERIAAIPRATPVAKPVRSTRTFRTGRGTRPMMLAAAVLALTLGLIAGGVFISSSRQDAKVPLTSVDPTVVPSPTPTPEPTPTLAAAPSPAPAAGILPDTIPEGVENGEIDTPIGPARWVHLHDDTNSLPDPYSPIRMPDGRVAWFEAGGPGSACFNAPTSLACTDPPRPTLFVADDVLAARSPVALPVDAATGQLSVFDDTFWYVSADPTSVWHSTDLTDWVETDIAGIVSPGSKSIDWTASISVQPTADGSPIATVWFTPTDPGALLGYPGQPVRLATDDTGGFVASLSRPRSAGGPKDLGPISVKEAPGVLSFIDGTGVEVGRVEAVGISREFADSWAKRGEIRYDRLFWFDGRRWSLVELPLSQLPDWPLIVPMDDATMLFSVEPDQSVRAWRTTDGRTWTGGDPAVDAAGTPLASSGITYQDGGDGPVILVYGIDGTSGWRSSDGETWTFAVELQGGPSSVRFDHGWMRTADMTEGVWQVSLDGKTWEDVPALLSIITKTAPDGAGGSTEYSVGNTVFFQVDEDEGTKTRDIWMIEFAVPGS